MGAHHTRLVSGALSLHGEIPELGLTYRGILKRAKRLGCSHIALVNQAVLTHVTSSHIRYQDFPATPLPEIRRVANLAKSMGFQVFLFPILWIEQRAEGEWRGTLKPTNPSVWWSTYEEWLTQLAILAQEVGASQLSIGSELSSMEKNEGRWRSLIRRLRVHYSGQLIYSANWDHYRQIKFWDALDLVGVTGYFPLSDQDENPPLSDMIQRWSFVRMTLLEWLTSLPGRRTLFFTELGYPSQRGGARQPWHYLQSTTIDLTVQQKAFRAFREVWGKEPKLGGINIWNLWGLGGPSDAWYTLWGKPSVIEVKQLIKVMRSQ